MSAFALKGYQTGARHTVDIAIHVNIEYKCATAQVFYWGS
jgi:hypothetical protein